MLLLWLDLNSSYAHSSLALPAIHAQAARELQKNPDSEFQIFEGCGHILHLEEIEKFNQAVIDFLYKIQKD